MSSYILVFASLLLAGGRLADVWGRKRLFLIGLSVFTAASLAAGLAGNVDVLVISRAVQGLGAALVTPTTLAIISATFTNPRQRAVAVGIWSGVGALALAVGPLLGGVLSQYLSWGWIFFVNVPVGLATMALGAAAIRESREGAGPDRLDLPGVITSAGALFALTFALIEGHDRGWTSTVILSSFAVAAVLGVVFVRLELRVNQPMVSMSLFRERVFSGGLIALMMWGFGLFGIYFFTSLYLQGVLGFSPTKAGAAFVPMALLMAAGSVISERVSHRLGAYRVVGAAMLLMAAGVASVSLLGADADFASLMPSFAVIGIGGGLTVPLTSSVLEAMPRERGRCRVRDLQRLPRGGRAAGHHRHRRGADRAAVGPAVRRSVARGRLPGWVPGRPVAGRGVGGVGRCGRLHRSAATHRRSSCIHESAGDKGLLGPRTEGGSSAGSAGCLIAVAE